MLLSSEHSCYKRSKIAEAEAETEAETSYDLYESYGLTMDNFFDEDIQILDDEAMCEDVNDCHVEEVRVLVRGYKLSGEACGIRGAGDSKATFYRNKMNKMSLQQSASGST